MPIITFSSSGFQKSGEIAEKTAEALGYRFLDRGILKTVSEKYNIPEERLTRALDEIPTFMGMSDRKWKQSLAAIQATVLGELLEDNVVCHGLATHLYVLGVSHVLKIGIIEDSEEKARWITEQEMLPIEKARKKILQKEKSLRKWSLEGFNLDETNPSLYDMVINISQIDSEEAIGMISTATGYKKFRPMTYSIKCMQDRELSARVRAVLLNRFPDVRVEARDGTIVVKIKAIRRERTRKTAIVKELAGNIPGVQYVEVHIINDIFRQAAESGRW